MSELERRAGKLELRASGRKLEGYAAVFDMPTDVGGFTETIEKGAFKSAHDRDVLALVDHDPLRVLARSKSGSLKLAEDAKGLSFEIAHVPSTSYGNDVLELVRTGDAGGCSFGFSLATNGDEWHGKRRTLRSVILHEISIVSAWPAYPQTTVAVRNMIANRPPSLAIVRRKIELLQVAGGHRR